MPTSSVSKVRRRKIVWSKTPNNICAHCGKVVSASRQTVDHFIPISMGGTDDKYNLMPLCWDCNTERRSDTIEPSSYYRYAYPWAIKQCCIYKRQWMSLHRNVYGAIMTNTKKR